MNKKVVLFSILGLVCLVLMYFVSWWFVVPALAVLWLNQKELFEEKS